MSDLHAVFAVLDTAVGPHKVRVSEPLPWRRAVALHDALHRPHHDPFFGVTYSRPVVRPGYTVYARPVRHFAVRDMNDPAWPSDRPRLTVKDARDA